MMMSCLPLLLKAQGQAVVSGTVTDRTAGEPLPAATVSIAPASDTSAKTYTSTDGEGAFAFRSMAVGSYVVSVSYVGFKPMEKRVKITDSKQTYTLRFVIEEDAQVLGEVSVQGRATRAEQRGDSLQYNAEAFQVMEAVRPKTCWPRCRVSWSKAVPYRRRANRYRRCWWTVRNSLTAM